ncbi:MAG: hypothetical protein IJ806_05600 [Ruminococcus sp.]|nr:hypothetical protein [Ruminococcus sp.]
MSVTGRLIESIAPEGGMKSQLRTLTGLISVIAVISPFIGDGFRLDIESFSIDSEIESESLELSEQVDDTILSLAAETFEEYFEDKLNKNGIKARIRAEAAFDENGEIVLEKLTVFSDSKSEQDVIERLLGEDTEGGGIGIVFSQEVESQ